MRLLTIGYGTDDLASLMIRLRKAQVGLLIDVRTNPYSRYQPDFRTPEFEHGLQGYEMPYLFMGKSVGGKPIDPSVLTDGKVDYEKLERAEFFVRGIDQLVKISRDHENACLMCGCQDPATCHRGRLLGPALEERGVEVIHILKDGSSESQAEVQLRNKKWQSGLFD